MVMQLVYFFLIQSSELCEEAAGNFVMKKT